MHGYGFVGTHSAASFILSSHHSLHSGMGPPPVEGLQVTTPLHAVASCLAAPLPVRILYMLCTAELANCLYANKAVYQQCSVAHCW